MANQTTKTEPKNDFKACLEIAGLCKNIGDIASYHPAYVMLLTRKIQESGKAIQDWTLGELHSLNEQMGEIYNSMVV